MYKFLIINFFRQQVKFLTFAPNWCPDVCRGEKGIWCKSRAVPATVSSFQLLFYNPLFRKIIGMGRKKSGTSQETCQFWRFSCHGGLKP